MIVFFAIFLMLKNFRRTDMYKRWKTAFTKRCKKKKKPKNKFGGQSKKNLVSHHSKISQLQHFFEYGTFAFYLLLCRGYCH